MEIIHYTVKIRPAKEGGYWAEVPALPGCMAQAETLAEVKALAEEAIECYLTGLLRRGEPFPAEKHAQRGFTFPVSVRAPRAT